MAATLCILVPILAGLALYALPKKSDRLAQIFGIVLSGLIVLYVALSANDADVSVRWLSRPFVATFHVGFGGISFWIALLLALTTFTSLVALTAPSARDFVAQLLILEGAMMGVFLAKDLLLFALFWDLMLVPVFLLMVGWGVPSRRSDAMNLGARGTHQTAAWRYLIYNMVGGLALLLATAAFGVAYGTTNVIGAVGVTPLGEVWAPWILTGFALAFLIKTPVWPLHTWMPETYAELPSEVVAVVSAVQSKAGLYGFIVIGVPLFAHEMHRFAPVMFVLGLVALVYGALVALTQTDAKKIVAYSSLSHLGLILIGIFSFNDLALRGSVVYLIAHGLFSAALFLTLGYIERREETRDISRLGGLAADNPRLAGGLMLAALAALGLPGLAGFAGELLIMTGLYAAGYWWAALIALVPIVLAAAYMLRLFQMTMNGPHNADLPKRRDLSWGEGLALAPLVIGFVLLGVNPGPVAAVATNVVHAAVALVPAAKDAAR